MTKVEGGKRVEKGKKKATKDSLRLDKKLKMRTLTDGKGDERDLVGVVYRTHKHPVFCAVQIRGIA